MEELLQEAGVELQLGPQSMDELEDEVDVALTLNERAGFAACCPDATVLSNYASTDSVTWLTTTLDDLWTVPAVRTELEQGREVGYAYLEHAPRWS